MCLLNKYWYLCIQRSHKWCFCSVKSNKTASAVSQFSCVQAGESRRCWLKLSLPLYPHAVLSIWRKLIKALCIFKVTNSSQSARNLLLTEGMRRSNDGRWAWNRISWFSEGGKNTLRFIKILIRFRKQPLKAKITILLLACSWKRKMT